MPAFRLAYSEEPNLAAAEGLRGPIERQRQDTSIEVEPEWFRKTRKELEQEDKETWDNETLKWALVFSFCEGRHLLKRAKYGHGWRPAPLPERTDLPVYGFNLTGFYSENIKAKWAQSTTDIMWRPARETDDAIGMSKAGTAVHEHYARKLYTNAFRQMEALLAQCGKYARYYYYTDEVKENARRPRIEQRTIQFGESTFYCPDCGSSDVLPAKPALESNGSAAPVQSMASLGEGAYAPNVPLGSGEAGVASRGSASARGLNGPAALDVAQANVGGLNEQSKTATSITENIPTLPGYNAGVGALADTSHTFDGGGLATPCPVCRSPNAELMPAEPFNVEAVAGYDEVETGSIVCEPVPAFELKHDLGELPQDSPYLIRRRRVRLSLLQSKFPFLHIKQSKGDNRGLQIAESLKRTSAQGGMVWSKDAQEESATDFIQVWLDPCMYSRLRLKSDMRTLDGVTIPAGTNLVDLFPKGLYMCFIEGIEGVVELRNEHHRDYWVGQVYRQRAISSLGTGLEDIVEGNRQLNLIYSIIYTQLRTSAMPATLFDERLLPNGASAYLGSLSNIPVNLSALEDKKLSDAVHQLQPQPPTAQHFGYADKLNQYMQLASRVTEFSGGLPGVNNTTATGAQITQATAQSLFGPQLALKADVDRRGAEIILQLFKTYCIDEVWVTLAGKRGRQDGMWLAAGNISTDLYAEVVPDSYLPQTNLERRERWDGFLQRVGGLPGLKAALQQFPEQVEQLAEIFDVDLASADYTAAAEMCRLRIEQMKAALPMLQVMQQGIPATQMAADPLTGEMVEVPVDPLAEAGEFLLGILAPPIEPEEVGHLASISYYRSCLTEDEFLDAPPELRAGIKAAIRRHVEGLIAEAQLTGMVAMAGMPPAPAPGMDAGQESPKVGDKNPNPQAKQMRPPQEEPKKQAAGATA
jgi:hypothetical protein